MATVKLQNGNVILKDGKVSCSCCVEPECCMYPAAGYGILYQFDDLPDQIQFKYTNPSGGFFGPYTLTKTSGENVGYVGGPEDEVIVENAGDFWAGADGGGATGGGGECLIYNYKQEADLFTYEEIVEDFFADTYAISGPASGTVTRVDSFREEVSETTGSTITIKYDCGLWTGSGLRLSFNSTKCKWTVNGNEKSGNQNTPVGSYAGSFTVS